ncbi:MAG: cytochrome b [Rhodospirillaceae bacterium]|nr:cytochrome b [Rhodospirillaceae bacterium]
MNDLTQTNGVQWRNTHERYGAVSIALHWTIVLLFLGLYGLAYSVKYTTGYDSEMGELHLYLHKPIGVSVLALALVRVWWRSVNIEPPLPAAMPNSHKLMAHWTHMALYAIMFVQPLAGMAMDIFRARPVKILDVSIFPAVMERNDFLAEHFADMVHNDYMDWIIALVVAAHAGAALKHHIIDRDDVLTRMLPAWAGGKRT